MNSSSTSVTPSKPFFALNWLQRIGSQNLSLLFALALLAAIFGFLRPDVMFSYRNIINIGLAVTVLGVLALAQTIVIVSGGLDISVGSIVGLSTMAAALTLQAIDNTGVGILAALAAGLAAGVINGVIITYGHVNSVIATLGTMTAFRGAAFLTSGGNSIAITNEGMSALGSGTVFGLPIQLIVLAIIAAGFFIFLRNTIIGRNIYALGGNRTVARLAGIDINRYQICIYAMSGLAAGLAGVLLTARTLSGQPASGSQGIEMEAITAAILGGCALQGGKGTVGGTLLGVLILGVLNNGMILTSVPQFYQLIAKGALLVGAVMIQEQQLRRSGEG